MRILSLFIALWLLSACNQSANQARFQPEKEAAVIATLMAEQQSDWNTANIEGFMKHYWQSDSLKFVGKRGITYGWQATLDNYRKSYPDGAAMGRLQFTNISIEVTDPGHAFVIGKWELFRTADTLSGHYSLLWKKVNENWVIVADHSS